MGDLNETDMVIGGFAVMDGKVSFSSACLNCFGTYSDDDKRMSELEQALVEHVVGEWKVRGIHMVVSIPDRLHHRLAGAPSTSTILANMERPRRNPLWACVIVGSILRSNATRTCRPAKPGPSSLGGGMLSRSGERANGYEKCV